MTSRLFRRIGIPLVVVVTFFVGRSAFAQSGTTNPISQVIAKLDQILAVLSPTTPGPVTLATSAVFVTGDDLTICTIVNLGTSPLNVTFAIRNNLGAVLAQGTAEVPPGGGQLITTGNIAQSRRCEFSFDGLSNDVRANMQIFNNGTTSVLEAR